MNIFSIKRLYDELQETEYSGDLFKAEFLITMDLLNFETSALVNELEKAGYESDTFEKIKVLVECGTRLMERIEKDKAVGCGLP